MQQLKVYCTQALEYVSSHMEMSLFLVCFFLLIVFGLMVLRLHSRATSAEKRARQVTEEALRRMDTVEQAAKRDAEETRMEVGQALSRMDSSVQSLLGQIENVQQGQADAFSGQLRAVQMSLNERLGEIGQENRQQMEALKSAVQLQINDVVDRRFEDSFSQVSGRLEQVNENLKKISTLAGSVDEFNRIVGGTQPMGIYGEAQLGNLLAQMLAPQQYAQKAKVHPGRDDTADYAVVMPGQSSSNTVYLPIDASLPMREYQELRAAMESGSREAVENARDMLESAVRMHARRVSEHIIAPPFTTDYAIVFLQSEGLYAEILRIKGLAERIQQESRIILAGPATLAALLSSLQVGFRSLAIEQHTDEIVSVLSAVRTDFVRYAGVLERTQKRLRQASEEIEHVQRQGETISRRLSDIGELPGGEAKRILGTESFSASEDEDDWD